MLKLLAQNGVSSVASDAVIVVFLALMTLGSFFALVYFLCKYSGDETPAKRKKTALAVILVVGAVIRIAFGLCIRGYREDYALFTDMFNHLGADGLKGYYTGDASAALYPVVYFIYLIFGGLSNVTGLTTFDLGAQFMVKLPLIGADLLIAYAVYKIAKRYAGERTALVLCAFVCVCPIFFICSVIWTSPIVYTALFAIWGCYFLARKKYAITILFMTVAAFCSKEGIFLFPATAVFSIYHLVRASINIKKDKPKGKAMFNDKYSAVFEVPCGFVVSVLLMYLIGLFMIASYNCNPFKFIYEFTIYPLVGWKYFTYNGISIYTMFNQNGQEASARFPSWVFACIFAAIVTAVVCIVYLNKRNRANMVMLCAYSLFTLAVYFPGMNAVAISAAFAALLGAYALVKDKRLLHVLFLGGLIFVINSSSVLANAGYLNNLADFSFSESSGYVGSALMSGGMNVLGIICSVFAVLTHLYFTVVTVGIGLTGQKQLLEQKRGMGASLKEFFVYRKAPDQGGK